MQSPPPTLFIESALGCSLPTAPLSCALSLSAPPQRLTELLCDGGRSTRESACCLSAYTVQILGGSSSASLAGSLWAELQRGDGELQRADGARRASEGLRGSTTPSRVT
ncbi:hypothetical protein CDD83_1490 [Cordyceps sp. RAO-2017]|nr:hypothetical protein CDD83_1490 [Cordyceps sp. RAO-2017]